MDKDAYNRQRHHVDFLQSLLGVLAVSYTHLTLPTTPYV